MSKQHSTQDKYEHFLAYSGYEDDAVLRYAYFHGADEGLDRPTGMSPKQAIELVECLLIALVDVEKNLVELEHAVGGGDGEIYVESAILSARAAIAKATGAPA